jgi:hypothetical protein
MQIFGETTPRSVISLTRYAQLIGYTECAFFGVAHEKNTNYACKKLWSQNERDMVLYYLSEAQDEIEKIIQYPLQPTWFEDEKHKYTRTRMLMTEYGKILAFGTKAISVVSDNALIDLTTVPDLGVISISPFSQLYPLSELHVFYPDSDVEIIPSNIQFDSGTATLTITIPRCRLVEFSKRDNPEEGLIYTEDDNFQKTADIHRIYTDTASQGKLWYRDNLCTSFCTETFDSVCAFGKNMEIGSVMLDSSCSSSCCSKGYESMSINYVAGLSVLSRQAETVILRLAHAKMPEKPCGCDYTESLWRRDTRIPEILTKERIECPFGMSDGAWIAWKWACGLELKRAGVLI